ncbi:unnamed protein product [Blepharisma stoltei]|uniref:pyruvate kinase n=1 Tax=Blepharisma stoltei TaxID=1481888 RepID=A0AAU9JUW8_9CILI|nr:unnamed protein product [Blepharisma stoltei]
METRKTKIIMTIGKASSSKDCLRELIKAGVDGIRISTRFIRPEDKDIIMRNLREAEIEAEREVCVILSLRESDIRIGSVDPKVPIVLNVGDVLKIVNDASLADDLNVAVCNNREFPNLVHPGDKLLLEFGKIVLTVLNVGVCMSRSQSPDTSYKEGTNQPATHSAIGPRHNSASFHRYQRSKPKSAKNSKVVFCKVENRCVIDDQIPVNFSNTNILDPDITNDMEDIRLLEWAGQADIDVIVYKQVRGEDDLESLWSIRIPHKTKRFVGIQTKESVSYLDNFIDLSDGASIGRGILGVETGLSNACRLQKSIIKKCNDKGKPVVLSTQVLESMVSRTKPSRSEVTDVTNMVFDGVDGILLTGETAYGRNPLLAVKSLESIILESEGHIHYEEEQELIFRDLTLPMSIAENVCYSAVRSVSSTMASLIICITKTGKTAQKIVRYKPACMVLGITDCLKTLRFLRIVRGVYPVLLSNNLEEGHLVENALHIAKEHHLALEGQTVIYVGGSKDSFIEGDTSLLRFCTIP